MVFFAVEITQSVKCLGTNLTTHIQVLGPRGWKMGAGSVQKQRLHNSMDYPHLSSHEVPHTGAICNQKCPLLRRKGTMMKEQDIREWVAEMPHSISCLESITKTIATPAAVDAQIEMNTDEDQTFLCSSKGCPHVLRKLGYRCQIMT